LHRVVFSHDGSGSVPGETSSGPRYSIAFFCHPVASTPLGPVPSERVKNFAKAGVTAEANPYAERKVLTADEHLYMRLKASYGDLYKTDKS
jgi:isopenicillin N synthase-like dioxygenase